jgi:hypothetical protein
MTEFQQPQLEGGAHAESEVLPARTVAQPASNAGKTDELSLAAAEAARPKVEEIVEPERPRAKYFLSYDLDGEAIKESHATIPHALARIAALKALGITPSTSTAE